MKNSGKNASKPAEEQPGEKSTQEITLEQFDSENLHPLTVATSEPALRFAEQEKLANTKKFGHKLRATSALAASTLLATSLLLSACGTDDNDCIPVTPPSNTNPSTASYVLPAPDPASLPPATPGSTQFTSGQPATATQTYCQSRRTGGFYWYTGSRYYSGYSSSSSSS